jgi:hypothetical protein
MLFLKLNEKHENRDSQAFASETLYLIFTLIESIFSIRFVRISETPQHKIPDCFILYISEEKILFLRRAFSFF